MGEELKCTLHPRNPSVYRGASEKVKGEEFFWFVLHKNFMLKSLLFSFVFDNFALRNNFAFEI